MTDTPQDRVRAFLDEYTNAYGSLRIRTSNRGFYLSPDDLSALLNTVERQAACIRDFVDDTDCGDPGEWCDVCRSRLIDGHNEFCPHTVHADTIKEAQRDE